MCQGDAPKKELFFKTSKGDIIYFEFYSYDSDIGKSHVQINELSKKNFEEDFLNQKIKPMPKWMEGKKKSIIIYSKDFEDTLNQEIERAFEEVFLDDLSEKETEQVTDDLYDKIYIKFKKRFLRNIRTLD